MSTTQQSKRNYQPEKYWFQKDNYPAKWLNEESINIIKNIIKKK